MKCIPFVAMHLACLAVLLPGVGITITLLGVLSLALFITTIVFLSKYNAAQRQLTANITEREEYIRGNEIQSDAIQRLRTEAKKDGNKSVVGYLNESLKQTMTSVSGTAGDSYTELTKKLKGVPGAESNNLLGVILNGVRSSVGGYFRKNYEEFYRYREVGRPGAKLALSRKAPAAAPKGNGD